MYPKRFEFVNRENVKIQVSYSTTDTVLIYRSTFLFKTDKPEPSLLTKVGSKCSPRNGFFVEKLSLCPAV